MNPPIIPSSVNEKGFLVGEVQSDSEPSRWYAVWRFGERRDRGGRGTKWTCVCPSRREPCKHLLSLFEGTVDPAKLRVTTEGAAVLLHELEAKVKAAAAAIAPPLPLPRETTDQVRLAAHPALYTIGHGSRTYEEFFARLDAAGVTTLVDVRSFPGSRWAPQFRKPQLKAAWSTHGGHYLHMPELGGYNADRSHPRVKDAAWKQAIEQLVQMARSGAAVVVMCMERDPNACHRHIQIEPDVRALAPDVEILHLGTEEKSHEPAPRAPQTMEV